jgi:DNA mismatch endonuclease (patch repair protein)
MSRIGSKNTKPELLVRKVLHGLGYRFRLHRNDLPGKPDIVLSKYKTVVFVHGCFWHGHSCKKGQKRPATNKDFWDGKLNRNIERDKENISQLENLGWNVLTIWECQVKDINQLMVIISESL